MNRPLLAVSFPLHAAARATLAEEIGQAAEIVALHDLGPTERTAILARATVLLARNTGRELQPGEAGLLAQAKLVQFMTAGVDYIPLRALPEDVPIACNGGAYAEPMAEHGLAMVLAAAKRLAIEQAAMKQGGFNQFANNRMLAGGVCGILGFGGIGIAMARLMRAMGMRIHAIRRSGTSEAAVDWIGTPDRLDEMLAASDVLVLSLPLTNATRGSIDARALRVMKPDAILVNLARGETWRRRICTGICWRIPASPPASIPGGSNRCGMAISAWTSPSWICPMSSPRRIIRPRCMASRLWRCAMPRRISGGCSTGCSVPISSVSRNGKLPRPSNVGRRRVERPSAAFSRGGCPAVRPYVKTRPGRAPEPVAIFELLLALLAACVVLAVVARLLDLPLAVTLVIGGMGSPSSPAFRRWCSTRIWCWRCSCRRCSRSSAYRTDWPAFRTTCVPSCCWRSARSSSPPGGRGGGQAAGAGTALVGGDHPRCHRRPARMPWPPPPS